MSRVLNVYRLMGGIEKYVVSGAVAGLTSVAWHDDASAFTDGTTIHLPRPNALWDDESLLLWRYKAEHELGHEDAVNSNPHWKEVMEDKRKNPKYKEDGMLWWIANLISDHVQERNRVGDMIGRDEVLLHGRVAFYKTGDEAVKKMSKAETDHPDMDIAAGLFHWDTKARMSWNMFINNPVHRNDKAKEVAELVEAKSGVDFTKLHHELDVFNAAVKVRELFPSVPPKNHFMKMMLKGKGKGDGEGKEKGKKEEGGIMVDRSDPFMANGNHGEAPKASGYKYEAGNGVYTPRTPVPLSRGRGRHGRGRPDGHHIDAVKSKLLRTNLPAKVRGYLMAMKREKYTTGYRSGRLDTNRLPDVLRGKDDLFRRKEPVLLVDSAISLLVDSSGSMSGKSFESACASALMLAEALQGVGCSIEVAGFTEFSGEDHGGLIHDIWQPFGQRFVRDNVLEKMAVMSNHLSNNTDGENILYAYNRLKVQKQSRKILIVLSDGQPSGSGPHGATIGTGQFTKNVCETIQKDKSVLLVGLGMSGYKPSKFYKNCYQVDAYQPLEPVLLGIVKDAVLRKE